MLITEGNLDIWYNDYKKQFEKTKKFVKSRGGDVENIRPLSRRAFAADFRMIAADNEKAGGKSVSTKLAKEQFSVKSTAQAEKLAEAFERESGVKKSASTVTAFKYGTAQADVFYQDLIQINNDMKLQGISSAARAKIISQEFFGSE